MNIEISYRPIGVIHSPFTDIGGMPIQPTGAAEIRGTVEVFPEFAAGLKDLEGFSHIENVDILDGTPLLDIKPYVPGFDQPLADRVGWLEQSKGRVQSKKSDSRFR